LHIPEPESREDRLERIVSGKKKNAPEYSVPESFSGVDETIVTCGYNGLVGAIHMAFDQHRPLILDPDCIWLAISQSLARHIEMNAEELRHHFVNHEGKETIKVVRNNYIKGSQNNWIDSFDEFSSKIKDYIGKKHDLIIANFSTTGPLQKAVSEIVLMDSMKSYFSYECYTWCGIPSITLEGTVEDWKLLRSKAQCLGEFGLSDWVDNHLLPVLDQFVEASQGNVDKKFWKSIYNMNGGSGKPNFNGWVNTFFLYLKDGPNNFKKNDNFVKKGWIGTGFDELPSGLSKVPFKWIYHDKTFDMEFVGGIIGIEQFDDMALKPKFGWAVQETKK